MRTELNLSDPQRSISSELLESFRGTRWQAMDTITIMTIDIKDTCPGIHFCVYVGQFHHLSLIWRTLKILLPTYISICISN